MKIKPIIMKSTIRISTFVLLLAGSLFLKSCSEVAEPGVPQMDPDLAQVKLEMKAQTNQSTINSRIMNTGLVFNEVLLGVTELEFELLNEENDDDDIEFEGQFIVDLINGTSTPDFGIANIAPGIYEEIELEMDPILDGGLSIIVSFEFTNDNNEAVIVEYGNSDELEFEIENDYGFNLEAGVTNQILVMFDLDALFAGIDLNAATADNDGIVRINKSSNANLAADIDSNLDQILDAGKDDDDDGDIDDDDDYDDDDDNDDNDDD
jgi:hypothetical protein